MHTFACAIGLATLSARTLAAPTSQGECLSKNLQFSHAPTLDPSLSARVIANAFTRPRGIQFDSASNLLVIDRGVGVIALTESANNGTCGGGWEKRVIVQNAELNHGIEVVGEYLYASTSDELLRWRYDASSVSILEGPVSLVRGMGNAGQSFNPTWLRPLF